LLHVREQIDHDLTATLNHPKDLPVGHKYSFMENHGA